MRAIIGLVFAMGLILLLFVGRGSAQPAGPMMWGSMPMMGWPMMVAAWLFWLLLLILMVLAILWLIKQLRK